MLQPTQPPPATPFDVVVAGGGWVGMSLALMLPHHWRIALVEALPFKQAIRDERTLVLAHSSQRILATLQLWPELENAVTPIQQVHVSSSGRFATCRLSAEEFGLQALGYALSAQALTQALHTAIEQRANIVKCSPATVSKLTLIAGKPQVTLQCKENEQVLSASLVVAADGVHSKIRQMLQIPVKSQDYDQMALVANVQLARAHQNRSLERFMPIGPLAMVPCGKNISALVWCVPTQQATMMLQWSDEIFLQALQQAVGNRLGRLLHITPRSAFPVQFIAAQQLVKPGIVLVGSAACHLHPIAAQSLNLAFRDIAVLAELLTHASQQGSLPGDWPVLQHYENARRAEHNRIKLVTHGAVKLFSKPLQIVGALSLLAVDTLPIAKRQLIRHAVGLGSQSSKLASGLVL
jgi:2-octaprenyl-6-methoxyphenol hydroxylase